MRIIQKQISLEPVTSRLPGLYPAYKDGELFFFDDEHLKARGYQYPNNWGMIPVLLSINKMPSADDTCNDYYTICDGAFKMSWETMSKWYHFFTEYYHLLNDYGHCGVIYSSAVDYYENESRGKYAYQMVYGTERSTYEEMDRLFNERGGKVKIKGPEDCPTAAVDNGFYCWLRKNIISTPETDLDNVNGINTGIYAQFDNCKKEWICNGCDDVNDFKEYNEKYCFDPTIDGAINLQVTIDDMGEFAIFCKEYKLGESVYGDVMYKDGKAITLSKGTGYVYDEIFKEMAFNDTDWEDYTASYISENADSFDTNFKYYGYRTDGQKVTGDTEEAVKNQMSLAFNVTEKNGVMVNGDIYQVQKEEFLYYPRTNGKKYHVFREKDTQTPYTYFNGRKIYASLSTHNVIDKWYKFSFGFDSEGAEKSFPIKRTDNTELESYITYNGGEYSLNGKKVIIDNITYLCVDGYFNSDIGILYYKGDNTYRWYSLVMEEVGGYTAIRNEGKIVAFKKQEENPIIHNTGEITGFTTSKLEALCSKNALTDNAGYMLPGVFNFDTTDTDKTYAQPREGEVLDLLYEVGNTANIMPYKKTKTLEELLREAPTEDKKENYFIGDIITDMYFYYLGVDDSKTGSKWHDSSLETINGITKPTDMLVSENIFCDITYCIGATLIRKEGEEYDIYSDGNHGVMYMETVEFEKKNVEYYLKPEDKKVTPMQKNSPGYHSVSYPVVCYVIKKKEVEIDGETKYVDNTAYFISDSFSCKNGKVETYENDYVDTSIATFPIFRQEYMFGSATMQNIDANIYIDRGINAAFDKHIKLGEVTSMEALENYSNGYFKMMDN